MKVIPERRFINEDMYQAVLDKCGRVCVKCGTSKHLEVDHIVSVVDGGKTELDNLQMLCKRCNVGKREDNKDSKDKIYKRPMGRPPKFESPEQLQELIDNYFNSPDCDYTITGLILECGCLRETWSEYKKKPEYSDTIKRASAEVERAYEARLQSTTPTGSIFALKNMGWRDQQEVDIKDVTFKDEIDPPPAIQSGSELPHT